MGKEILLIAAVGLSFVCGCNGGSRNDPGNTNPAAPPAVDSVTGQVTFKGVGLAGVTVVAIMTNSSSIYATTTTDANGNYTFTGISATGDVPGNYDFFAMKAGYGFYPQVGAGGTVMRTDQTTMFSGGINNGTVIGFTLNVINYTATPNASLTGANFVAYDGSNPMVALAATGQTVSYVSGDDGALLKGVALKSTRFTDNDDGTVTDNVTGLEWLRNAGCFAPANWAGALGDANALASGKCGLTDGSKAGDWRLPNLWELESVVDISAANPALTPENPFVNVSMASYWTSTSYYGGQAGSPWAWIIRMSDGAYVNDSTTNAKTAANQVWAVKGTSGGAVKLQATGFSVAYLAGDDGMLKTGVPLAFPRFVDNGNGTITDTTTGLIWLKKANCIDQTWAAAVSTVNTLANGQCGLSDGSKAGSWRMPNRREMESLGDRMNNNQADFFNASHTYPNGSPFLNPIFASFVPDQFYWTSSTYAADTTQAWSVFSCDFGVYDTPKSGNGYTLAVR
jgi:hypothetical protein